MWQRLLSRATCLRKLLEKYHERRIKRIFYFFSTFRCLEKNETTLSIFLLWNELLIKTMASKKAIERLMMRKIVKVVFFKALVTFSFHYIISDYESTYWSFFYSLNLILMSVLLWTESAWYWATSTIIMWITCCNSGCNVILAFISVDETRLNDSTNKSHWSELSLNCAFFLPIIVIIIIIIIIIIILDDCVQRYKWELLSAVLSNCCCFSCSQYVN